MGLKPKIKKAFTLKDCAYCGGTFGPDFFLPVESIFYPDGYAPICFDCADRYIADGDSDKEWDRVDKLCQMLDIPFIPARWIEIKEMNKNGAFGRYAAIFKEEKYSGIGWGDYYKHFKELKEANRLEEELPGLKEDKRRRLIERWGGNYDDEALEYLERLYNGLLATQNVNGTLQEDQAFKICKISYEIDSRIRSGTDFDKLLGSYDKLLKEADFTPKNVKNINDFDSFGEVARWLEKNGWKNKYYDDVTRDVVDETIKNMQSFNQRLYINENGIGESITDRIEKLKYAEQAADSSLHFLEDDYDISTYDTAGYNELIKEDFVADVEGAPCMEDDDE